MVTAVTGKLACGRSIDPAAAGVEACRSTQRGQLRTGGCPSAGPRRTQTAARRLPPDSVDAGACVDLMPWGNIGPAGRYIAGAPGHRRQKRAMFRVVLTLSLLSAALAVPVESDTEFCNGETECPPDCSYVSRNTKCVFCMCGVGALKPGESVVGTGEPCPPGTRPGRNNGLLQVCTPDGAEPVPEPTPEPGSGCPHGQAFIDQCNNDCDCVDGKFYGCTRKACKPGEKAEVPMTCTSSDNLPERSGQQVVCEEGIVKLKSPACPHGDEYIDQCGGQCKCLPEGYACVQKDCQPGQTATKPMACSGSDKLPYSKGKRVSCHENIVKLQDKDADCLPGAVFKDECNECFCSDSGQSGCTLKGCIGEKSESTVTCEGGLPSCPADCGEVYNPAQDCYDCPCGVGKPGDAIVQIDEQCPSGTSLRETGAFTKACQPVDKCPHGLEFIDECGNDCMCQKDGYVCTRIACKPGQTAMKPMACDGSDDLPQREIGRVICHEKIVKVQQEDEACFPGSVFKEECNSCFCGDVGQIGCTLKECVEKMPENKCRHGEAFIDECGNDCSCVNKDFYACTFKACKPGQTSEKPMSCKGAMDLPERSGRRVFCHEGIVKTQDKDDKCLPGAMFMNECNQCTCGGACTLKACLK